MYNVIFSISSTFVDNLQSWEHASSKDENLLYHIKSYPSYPDLSAPQFMRVGTRNCTKRLHCIIVSENV